MNDHKTKECVNTIRKCANCLHANDRFKLELKANHSAYDINCPMYLKLLENGKKKIEYQPK